jgi:hypothetical protein
VRPLLDSWNLLSRSLERKGSPGVTSKTTQLLVSLTKSQALSGCNDTGEVSQISGDGGVERLRLPKKLN